MATLKEQLKLTTGKQEVTCPDCQKSMTATVSGVKKDGRRQVRHFRGTCRHCRTMFSGVLPLRVW